MKSEKINGGAELENLTLEEIEALPREYLTSHEVAAFMGISLNSFYRRHDKMPFPVLSIGRKYSIPKRPFLTYMRTGKCGTNL